MFAGPKPAPILQLFSHVRRVETCIAKCRNSRMKTVVRHEFESRFGHTKYILRSIVTGRLTDA
jgi:hypothetical protein